MKLCVIKLAVLATLLSIGSSAWANSVPVRSKSAYGTGDFTTTEQVTETVDGFTVALDCYTSEESCPTTAGGNYVLLEIDTPNLTPGTIINFAGSSLFNPSEVGLLCDSTPFMNNASPCTIDGFPTTLTAAQQACLTSVGDNYNPATNTLQLAAANCPSALTSGNQMVLLFAVDTATLPNLSITTQTATAPETGTTPMLLAGLMLFVVAKSFRTAQ